MTGLVAKEVDLIPTKPLYIPATLLGCFALALTLMVGLLLLADSFFGLKVDWSSWKLYGLIIGASVGFFPTLAGFAIWSRIQGAYGKADIGLLMPFLFLLALPVFNVVGLCFSVSCYRYMNNCADGTQVK